MSRSRQDGYILLALLLVVFVTGSSILLGSFNNRQQISNAQQSETVYQLMKAKEQLLAFAANSSSIFSDARGPGYLPCPDMDGTDDDPTPINSCDSNEPLIGRLPEHIDISGTPYRFTNEQLDPESRFWYVVSPRHVFHSDENMRTSQFRTSAESPASSLRLSLDDTANIVAIIIAPGEALEFQDRSGSENVFSEYSESMDTTTPFSFDSHSSESSQESFNDIVIGISHDEYMHQVGASMAGAVKGRLVDYYSNNLRYPRGRDWSGSNYAHQDFLDALPNEITDPAHWLVTEGWTESSDPPPEPAGWELFYCSIFPTDPSCPDIIARAALVDHRKMENMYYVRNSADTFTLKFFGCSGQSFRVTTPMGASTGKSC